MDKKRIIIGASGASGLPILKKCLELIQADERYESVLVMSESAKLTLSLETDDSVVFHRWRKISGIFYTIAYD